ncbi:MAG: Gfo/Idh/MocA family oxidoreductase [Chitinophagaceae bacterium]|jgi:predicted dehydrogenase|nr:Gfo/Idh/MocA family oxidoreductase [Chitinophagaceae bacterium]
MDKIKVLVVGCGHMGSAHATAYHNMDEFEVVGLVSRGNSNAVLNKQLNACYPLFSDYYEALEKTKPNAVSISTYHDTHEAFAIKAMESGCHVFIEKPLAGSVAGAVRVQEAAKKYNKKLVVGYILRHHPSWKKFIELALDLGKPLVMRMNLNQQSSGHEWQVHKKFLENISPIVDCGVHYIDVMCQMTRSAPVQVTAIGARLTNEIPEDNYNYGQLQIRFQDGSVGWYEAGWGPMMSETAFFIKDVIGPKGAASIVAKSAGGAGASSTIDMHSKTESILLHHSDTDANDNLTKKDEWIDMSDEPTHQELCNRQQKYFYDTIAQNIDLTDHINDAVNSLRIAFACDESVKTGQVVHIL